MSELVDIAIDCIYFECLHENSDICEHDCSECPNALCTNCGVIDEGFCEEQ